MGSLWAGDMRQTFYAAARTGQDARGVETYGTAVAYRCRYQPSSRLVRSRDGSSKVSSGILYTEAAVTVDHNLWPPGANPANVGESVKPISVDKHYDLESGRLDHYRVTF